MTRFDDEEPDVWDDDRDRYDRERDLPGCHFCGHEDHLTDACPVNPDSHIRKMVKRA